MTEASARDDDAKLQYCREGGRKNRIESLGTRDMFDRNKSNLLDVATYGGTYGAQQENHHSFLAGTA